MDIYQAIKKYKDMTRNQPPPAMKQYWLIPATWSTLFDFGYTCATFMCCTEEQALWHFEQQELVNVPKYGSKPVPTKFFSDRKEDFISGYHKGMLERDI